MSDGQMIAVIGGLFSLLVIVVQGLTMKMVDKGNKENTRDHGIVQEKLDGLSSSMQETKIDLLGIKVDIKDLDSEVSQLKEELHGHLSDTDSGNSSKAGKPTKKKSRV